MLVRVRVRGIVLLSILVLTLLTTFFIGALIQMNPSRLRRTVHSERHDLAGAAAKAGVEYALARLSQDPHWRGEGSGLTVDSPGLVVREDQGNVWGWVRPGEGEWAGFRLRFNYQDGENGADGLPQPSRSMNYSGISVNNITGASEKLLPIGDGPSFSFQGRTGYPVPEYSVALLVQGFVGPGISPQNLDIAERASGSELVFREVEGLYKVSRLTDSLLDGAVLQAGADSEFVLGASGGEGKGYLRLMADGQIARMRTKGNSTIRQGVGKSAEFNFYPDVDAEVRVGGSFQAKHNKTFSQKPELPNDVMLKVEWSKVSNSSQTDRMTIPGGVYAVSDAGSTERVKYYPMSFKEYRAALISGQTPVAQPLPPNFSSILSQEDVVVDGTTQTREVLTLTRDVEVTAGGAAGKDLAIVPASGVKQAEVPTDLDVGALEALPVGQRIQTGQSLITLMLQKAGNPSSLQLEVNGNPYTLSTSGNLIGGDAEGFAKDVFRSGGEIKSPGLLSSSGGGGAGFGPLAPIGTYRFTGKSLLTDLKGAGLVVPPALAESGDSLDIPQSILADQTVAQDIEVRFRPENGKSAAIRSEGSILLGTHLSGKGGAIIANRRVDLVGLGIDLEAANGERDGISIYSMGPVNISTYDPNRKKYWDVSIKGVVFSGDRIRVRMGEEDVSDVKSWGHFDFHGVAVALGKAPGASTESSAPDVSSHSGGYNRSNWGTGLGENLDTGAEISPASGAPTGYILMIADGIRMMYEPKYLAPYADDDQLKLSFHPISVVER